MARSINKVTLIGRLGRDPELKYTASGAAYCRFSIATDDSWTNRSSGERQERTEWHNIVAWERLAEICGQYLAKGRMVYIEGQIQSRKWEDQDGNKRTAYEIRAREMVLLGGPGGDRSGGGSTDSAESDGDRSGGGSTDGAESDGDRSGDGSTVSAESGGAVPITDDDIPF